MFTRLLPIHSIGSEIDSDRFSSGFQVHLGACAAPFFFTWKARTSGTGGHFIPRIAKCHDCPCFLLYSFSAPERAAALSGKPSTNVVIPTQHGCRWETFYIFAYCGLVGNPHFTANILMFAPFPTSTKTQWFQLSFGANGVRNHSTCVFV